jgi:hypothetical protein
LQRAKFIEQIRIKKYPIDVEDIAVNFENVKDEFEYFEIRRGEWHEELGERLDAAGKLLYRSVELSEKSVQLGEKSVQLGEKSVQLGEKSVQLTEESVKIGHTMLEKQDETIDEIRGLRYDMKAYMEQRFDNLLSPFSPLNTCIQDVMKLPEKSRSFLYYLEFCVTHSPVFASADADSNEYSSYALFRNFDSTIEAQ